jgi:2-C-methyl-D-erythritol 4-phosphate cytidylyltransferase
MEDRQPKFWALVPAAGTGTRMQSNVPKQYLKLGNRTVIEHTLDTLFGCASISGIILVLSTNDPYWPKLGYRLKSEHIKGPLEIVTGGAKRCHSVLNGLKHLSGIADENDRVLVHDAARPCVRCEDVELLIKQAGQSPDGGLLGMPAADTMKRVVDGQVRSTVDRTGLWHALTPQLFPLGALKAALTAVIEKGCLVTDEASAMEQAGYHPFMVEGHVDNIKVTLPADLARAGYCLQVRRD